jgi:RNA polymerase sigma-70 factor (ECF subfamily)
MMRRATTQRAQTPLFPATEWGLVEAAGDVEHWERRCEALARLWPRYRQGLGLHLHQKFHLDAEAIEEALQSFAVDKVLIANVLAEADQARGRFRTFLLRAVENHVRSALRRAAAAKRQPEEGFVSIEELPEHEHPDGVPAPSRDLDWAWAEAVLSEAACRMERECRAGGRNDIWTVFDGRGLEAILRGQPVIAYEELARRCGLQDLQKARLLLHDGKRMFRRAVETVIAEYVRDAEQVREELDDLVAILFAKA